MPGSWSRKRKSVHRHRTRSPRTIITCKLTKLLHDWESVLNNTYCNFDVQIGNWTSSVDRTKCYIDVGINCKVDKTEIAWEGSRRAIKATETFCKWERDLKHVMEIIHEHCKLCTVHKINDSWQS
jgi:hypothetical protein